MVLWAYYVSHVDVQGVLVKEKFGLFDKALTRFLDLKDSSHPVEVRLYAVPTKTV